MVANTLPRFHVLAALFQDSIRSVPDFLRHDRRYDLACFVLEHDPFLRREEFLLLREHIHDLDLVANVVALVFGIGNDVGHGGVRDFLAVVIAIALFPEQRFQLLHRVFAGRVKFKQFPHHRRFRFVNDQLPVRFCVAENAAVAEYDARLDGLLVTEFHTRGQLAQLVLRDRRHDGQAQFGILIERVDVVVLEEYTDTVAQKLARVLDRVERVSGEAGDFFGDDQVELAFGGVFDHAVEVFALFRGDTGQALVNVPRHECPREIPSDQILIVGNLIAQ